MIYATVIVSGVSLTNEREHSWHPLEATVFTAAPCVIVTVGAVADAIGTVKS